MKPITLLVNTLSSKKGKIVTWVASAAAGVITNFVASKNLTFVDPDLIKSISTSVGLGVGFLIESVIGWITANNIQNLQDVFRNLDPSLKSDGHLGDKTQAVAAAAVKAITGTDDPAPPPEPPVSP